MITQAYLTRENFCQVSWVASERLPKPGDKVELDGETWVIKEVYDRVEEGWIHDSR